MAPSSFASAAAGGNNNSNARADNSGDWVSRRTNGSTQTFRRTSTAQTASNPASQRDNTPSGGRNSSELPGVYIPPHRNGAIVDTRYSKESLLGLLRDMQEADALSDGLTDLYVSGWDPNAVNGMSGAPWGRRDESGRDSQHNAELCWDNEGTSLPLGLVELTEDERELFASVNSPLKPPTQSVTKEGQGKDGSTYRKTSISQGQSGTSGFGITSPTSIRPGNRRRETTDSFPMSPGVTTFPTGASRFSKDDPAAAGTPPTLFRRRTDVKEPDNSADEHDTDKQIAAESPVGPGNLKRSTTGGGQGSVNPWSTTAASGFASMGSFGNFALGTAATQPSSEKRPAIASGRSESRFKGLMSKDPPGEDVQNVKEYPSVTSSLKLGAHDVNKTSAASEDQRTFRPTSKDTDPYQEDVPTGSAALGGADDVSPPRPRGFGTPSRGGIDDGVFGAFGMTSDTVGGFPGMLQRDNFHHQTPQHRPDNLHEPMSPTDTNPYQSPENDKSESGIDMEELHNVPLPGLGGFGMDQGSFPRTGGFTNPRNQGSLELTSGERVPTSGMGASRGFPSLGGLGGLPGLGSSSPWGSGPGTIGTPTRERGTFGGAFGESLFTSSAADAQSPALAGLGSSTLFGANPGSSLGSNSSLGKGSKIGSLFPAALQEQMRQQNEVPRRSVDEGTYDGLDRGQSALAFNAPARTFNTAATVSQAPTRDTESPFRSGRGIFEGGFAAVSQPQHIPSSIGEPVGSTLSQIHSSVAAIAGAAAQVQPPRQSSSVASPNSDQPPIPQQRTMVMPDRMRWIYKDPSGNVQGPWTGLEMHDWYKAGFFTPELLIKKVEDTEYEPLAQLIRRIGNSREPFLVPQVGVPHDPPANQRNWAGNTGNGQPPFAGSFPSFGTTLTAEQQNALERRKQEEQYLMARQKEHLAQQQLLQKQIVQQQAQQFGLPPIIPQQIHHQSSAHSLHSQPSFGSITSPAAYQPGPNLGPLTGGPHVPGFFDNSFRGAPGASLGLASGGLEMLGQVRQDELPGVLQRLNLGQNIQSPIGGPSGSTGQATIEQQHSQQVQQMLADRMRLLQEQAEHDARMGQDEDMVSSVERLRQFQDLQTARGEQLGGEESDDEEPESLSVLKLQHKRLQPGTDAANQEVVDALAQPEQPTLTEQVQKSQSAKQSAQQTVWQKLDAITMQPIVPPPQSQSPMPAPIAQRMQNLADTLTTESRSSTQSPAVETPSASIAPWANQPVEAPKGPSLREIQEAEAKKAAQAEQIAAQARREALEKGLAAQTAAAQQILPGLPSTSTWASTQSPGAATPTSVWAKPAVGKVVGNTATPPKKTLQQIQKEEEARKQRAAAAATAASTATSVANNQSSSSGKRYADLASKSATPALPAAGSAWQTVGAGGKAKSPQVPTGPAVSARTVSGGVTTVTQAAKPKPVQRSTTMGASQLSKMDALNGFKEWAINDLRPHLNKGIYANEFVDFLLQMPMEAGLITETVHSSSQTIDSRHFAEEFVRRRKLADKGVVESSTSINAPVAAGSSSTGGWNEVAKKGPGQQPQKEEPNNFKVVPVKKKGSKR